MERPTKKVASVIVSSSNRKVRAKYPKSASGLNLTPCADPFPAGARVAGSSLRLYVQLPLHFYTSPKKYWFDFREGYSEEKIEAAIGRGVTEYGSRAAVEGRFCVFNCPVSVYYLYRDLEVTRKDR
ncbi:hypothetical protein EVAR_14025_1 [Eumeta japonica]|uniref:Uncharacterized protein n=1 Tax=Eumeta variegata TaxID=151549 RepID=A0A4C1XAQ6_EUMVA|nr:hypothetical protein EVAR_14025_1 [Eumeta japonica]